MINTTAQAVETTAKLLRLARVLEENYKHNIDHKMDLKHFEKELKVLKDFNLKILRTDDEKKAFWINLYNILIKYLIVKLELKGSLLQKPWLFFRPKVRVNDILFSLDDIEHGILRSNKKAKIAIFNQISPWSNKLPYICSTLDYRIHFALNCGAKSCPAVNFYEPENIDIQLDLAEFNFCKDNFVIDNKSKTLKASEIFKWYRKDFGDSYLDNPDYKEYSVMFKKYDWQVGLFYN